METKIQNEGHYMVNKCRKLQTPPKNTHRNHFPSSEALFWPEQSSFCLSSLKDLSYNTMHS